MKHEETKCLAVVITLVTTLAVAPRAWALPTEGLIAWWPFEGNANDASGHGNNGVVYGATLTTDRFGNPNSAYYFDGVNDYIDIGSGVKPSMPMTISAWVRLDSLRVGDQNPVFRNDWVDSGSNRYGVALYAGSWSAPVGYIDAQIYEGFSAPETRRNKYSNPPVVTAGDWHHLAAVYSSINDIRLYWDGMEILGTYDGTGSSLLYTSSGRGALGMFYTNVSTVGPIYFHGAMDCVSVYNRALTADEIRQTSQCPVIPAPSAAFLAVLGIGVVNRLRRQRVL